MGIQELIASLEKEADEKVRLIREDIARKTASLEEERAQRFKDLSEESEGEIAARSWALSMELEGKAAEEARAIMLGAERELAMRMRASAEGSLQLLRGEDYRDVFGLLASEFPDMNWERVSVNPADIPLAEAAFPSASITGDESISGGLAAYADKGAVGVVNTLEKRLELAWDSMLPAMIKEVLDGIKGNT